MVSMTDPAGPELRPSPLRRNDRDCFDWIGRGGRRHCAELKGHDLIHGEVLRGEDAVEPSRERARLRLRKLEIWAC